MVLVQQSMTDCGGPQYPNDRRLGLDPGPRAALRNLDSGPGSSLGRRFSERRHPQFLDLLGNILRLPAGTAFALFAVFR